MDELSVLKLLTTPLKPFFAVVLAGAGLYSLLINAKQATKQSYFRAARFARAAGWCYLIAGAGLFIVTMG